MSDEIEKDIPLRTKGDEVLSKKAVPVEDINAPTVEEFAIDMAEACHANSGVGLAAPQMGISLRMFVMLISGQSEETDQEEEHSYEVVINPEIFSYSEKTDKDWEGCLSIPGYRGLVPRPNTIKVKYHTLDGEQVESELQGYAARIFQHEYDHLDGILYPERMEQGEELVTEEEYQNTAIEALKRENEGKPSKD